MLKTAFASLTILCLLAGCGPFGQDAPTPVPAATSTPARQDAPTATGTGSALTPELRATATLEPTRPRATVPATATREPAPDPTATREQTPVPDATRQSPVSGPALEELEKIEEDAAKVRGLKPKADVPEYYISSAQLKENLKHEIDEEYSPEEGRRDTLLLWLTRFIDDPSLDLYQLQHDLLGEQVVGYYDPEKNELYVRRDKQELGPTVRATLAHEFVHSLQDQHYDLEKLRPDESLNDDEMMAVTALVEGDASISEILYAQQYMSKEEFQALIDESRSAPTTVLDNAPAYVRESLLFPYVHGAEFVVALFKQGGFDAVNDALARPPRSTEQILHPQKYLKTPGDAPKEVTLTPLTDTLGAGWTMRDADALGEFDLRLLLKENGIDEPEEAAAGWGGTSYALYQSEGSALAIIGTAWDTKKDADEFEAAMRRSFASSRQEGRLWTDQGRFFALKRAGDQIVFIGGTDQAAVERALAAIK